MPGNKTSHKIQGNPATGVTFLLHTVQAGHCLKHQNKAFIKFNLKSYTPETDHE